MPPLWRQVKPGTIKYLKFFIIFAKIIYFITRKEIRFVSITALSFIKDTEKFGHCMELIDAAVKPDHAQSLKKQLDKVEIIFVHEIDEDCLITLLEYHNIKRETKKRHKSNYMSFGARAQSHKAKLKKETNSDTFRHIQKPGTPEGHR